MKPKHAHKLKIQGAAAYASRLDAEDHASPEVTARILGLIETIRLEKTSRVERILASQMLATCTGLRALGTAPQLFELGQDDAVIDEARAAACLVLNSIFHDENYRLDLDSINNYKNYNDFINVIGFREALTEPLTDSPSPPASDSERQAPAAALISLAAHLPFEYDRRAPALAEASHEFRKALAAQLAPSMNAKAQSMPYGKYEQKQKIADWVNAELERYGLAVACPKTGYPGRLVADIGNDPETGRFQIQAFPQGKRVRSSSDHLPNLVLIDADPTFALENSGLERSNKGSREGRSR